MKKICTFIGFFGGLFLGVATAQQVADTAFVFDIAQPKYAVESGSVVLVDAAHHNFHTLAGRYAPFGKLLRRDGYRMASNSAKISAEVLRDCRIFVISNPLDSTNTGGRWRLPTPSAFSAAEMAVLHAWVKSGGRLLLIADHMPFAGAAQELAQSFGFQFFNCFALDNRQRAVERFYRGNGSLADNEITRGIDTVVTFTGSAFRLPKGAKPLLALKNYTISSPQVAWQFEENTPTVGSDGFYQGACMAYGKGKIVVMGEAAMFTAQLAGPQQNPVGLNAPEARQNNQFLLNVLHWLDE
jgi:hypothetical protein